MKNVSFDYSQFKKFIKNFNEKVKKFDQFNAKFLFKMANKALAKTKERTPIGEHPETVSFLAWKSLADKSKGKGLVTLNGTPYHGGTMRNSWRISCVMRKGTTLYVLFTNPLEYSGYVENGHRIVSFNSHKTVGWQNGQFMAKISLEEIEKEIPPRYEKDFKIWLEGLKE